MKITDIVQTQRNKERYSVYLEGEYWNVLDAETILTNHLRIGMEVDTAALSELFSQKLRRDTRERAYRLLSNRAHSKKELYDKLMRDAPPEVCSEIIEMLSEVGLLNDEVYAVQLAEYYLQRKRIGVRKAIMEMQRKGIDRVLAEEALSSCEVDTVSQICAVIEKKYYNRDLNDFRERQRVTAALSRLGFIYSDIKEAYERLGEDLQEEPDMPDDFYE